MRSICLGLSVCVTGILSQIISGSWFLKTKQLHMIHFYFIINPQILKVKLNTALSHVLMVLSGNLKQLKRYALFF